MDKLIERHQQLINDANNDIDFQGESVKHANITKEVAIGFARFKEDYILLDGTYYILKREYLNPDVNRMWNLSSLFDIYLKTL